MLYVDYSSIKLGEIKQAVELDLAHDHSLPTSEEPKTFNEQINGTFLVVQWLRIHLPMQGTQVLALVREDPTYRGATKPVRHNY